MTRWHRVIRHGAKAPRPPGSTSMRAPWVQVEALALPLGGPLARTSWQQQDVRRSGSAQTRREGEAKLSSALPKTGRTRFQCAQALNTLLHCDPETPRSVCVHVSFHTMSGRGAGRATTEAANALAPELRAGPPAKARQHTRSGHPTHSPVFGNRGVVLHIQSTR